MANPIEINDFISGQFDENGRLLVSGALSLAEIEILDLIGEGEIDGLVSGEYIYSGNAGEVGYRTVEFKPYPNPPNLDVNWLRSIYWNSVPLVNSNNQYNYQRIDTSYTNGTRDGSLINQTSPELTISRAIGERLRGSEIDPITKLPILEKDYAKIYRILNKECKGILINVKIGQLSETVTDINSAEYGHVKPTFIEYKVYYKPIYNNANKTPDYTLGISEKIEGKITYGYIKSSRVTFFNNTSNTVDDDFIGWEIKIIRTTPESTSSSVRNQTLIDSITEIYIDVFLYPNSSIVRSRFSAEFFAQLPERAFDTRLLKVKVPTNYNPIKKTYGIDIISGQLPPNVNDYWIGEFKENREWTDNPAWCFYDLITNPRYGLGKYISEDFVDKWGLYEISKYCDELVPDGFGGVEPRFSCNLIINSREEAFKVVNDMASIFRGIAYYGNGFIYAIQDAPKDAIVMFNNTNVKDGDFNYSSSSKKVRHTVAIVRYNDKTNYYKPALEYVEDIEGIKKYGIRELDLTAFGCTSRGQAVRFGRWALLSETLQTETISFSAGLEAAYLRPGTIFKVYDLNKKIVRYAGRTNNIRLVPESGKTQITLDDNITLIDNVQYNLSLLTPTFNYDPSLVSGLDNLDYNNIRRNSIQSGRFGLTDIISENNKSIVTLNNLLDKNLYNLTGQLVWAIELTGSINTISESNKFIDENTDYYRTLNIEEKDINEYNIAGINYNFKKYIEIESGLGFDTTASISFRPVAPTALRQKRVVDNIFTEAIDLSFVSDNYSGVSHYRVYATTDNFPPTGLPNDNFLISTLPPEINQYRYVPTTTGDHKVRIYSYNQKYNIYSEDFVSGSITITKTDPIKNIIISSLRTELEPTGNIPGTLGTGRYFNDSPIFTWQAGISGTSSLSTNYNYRITIREPSTGFLPSNLIYFQETGLNLFSRELKYEFSFEKNLTTSGGPYREYDIIIEAADPNGNTSAGNTIGNTGEIWSNIYGYSTLRVKNDRITGIFLSTQPNVINNSYQTNQWIDPNGSISIYFTSGDIPEDTQGGFIYSSTGIFSGQNITGNIPSLYPIKTGEFEYDSLSKLASIPSQLLNVKTGYIAISLYDKFDKARRNNGLSMFSGLYVSNVISLVPSGDVFNFNINNKLDIHNTRFQNEFASYVTTRSGSFWVALTRDELNNEMIIGSKSV
jgi:putative tail protein